MNEEMIATRVKEHQEYLQQLGYDVVCTMLQGSQNYGVDEYTDEYWSDVDTKSIVLPSLEDFIMNRAPTSEVIEMENGEHAEVKDIRIMFEMFRKMNISYIELLYSRYIIINPDWEEYIRDIFTERSAIAALNPNQFVRCIAGMAGEKRKALCHPYPGIIEKIERWGYDGKQLSHCVRLYEFLKKYSAGEPLEECYISSIPEVLLNLKKQRDWDGKELPVSAAIAYMEHYYGMVQDLKNQLIREPDEVDNNVIELLNKIKFDILKEKMRRELNG